MLLRTLWCIHLFDLGLFSSNINPDVELLDHIVISLLIISGIAILFSTCFQQSTGFFFSKFLPIFDLYLLLIAIFKSVSWYIIALIYISLKISNIEYLYVCVTHLYVFLLKMYIQIICPFLFPPSSSIFLLTPSFFPSFLFFSFLSFFPSYFYLFLLFILYSLFHFG